MPTSTLLEQPRSFVLLFLLFVLATTVTAVKREDFKTCSQAPFCRRQRAYNSEASASPYSLLDGSVQFVADRGLLKAEVVDERDGGSLTLELNVLGNGELLRLKLDDAKPLRPRYDGAEKFSIIPETAAAFSKDAKMSTSEGNTVLTFGSNGNSRAVITPKPFRIQVFVDDVPVVDVNAKGLLNYERYRTRNAKVTPPVQGAQVPLTANDGDGEEEKELWEERFKEFTDSNPNGPSSVGLDISFPGSKNVYGIPEHATSFSLKSTRGTDAPYSEPYRLYNLDVFEYVLDDPMALYGSIPYMVSHKKGHSAGVLWLNSAETWVDVWKETEGESGILSFASGRPSKTTTHAHWFSESGQLDAFILLGPSPTSLASQYARLTGYPALPPSFSIAYHQCRWNYMSQKEVREVDAGFDEHDIPYDVLWLDIEHTDGKRYFTWDHAKFPEPKKMIDALGIKGRKMVNIVDPHIKRDDKYYIFSEAQKKGIFVKDKDGNDFNGWCWPGSSSWIDYTNQEARDWWASKFAFDQYKQSSPTLHIWNDMNEPSVFNGPEITMPKDLVHHDGWEHRDVHNLYGMLFQRATSEGISKRGESPRRPFVLSRAFFAGSQRYGAIWTGDNLARWDHLAVAAPMLLSIGIAGLPFAGADVGGFFGNPEPELLARWYQAGSFQPFFRAHAHLDTKHREPWLFGQPFTGYIRDAIQTRYQLLPLWYTLFWEASVTGVPMMRPMLMPHPDDESMFAVDDQWMVGDSLLVKPVVAKGVTVVDVLLPGSQPWYDYVSHAIHRGPKVKVDAPLDKIPVFMKGGSIVPRRELVRRSSELMKMDPLTFVVAVDDQGSASGSLYLDDGETFAHQLGGYLHVTTSFSTSTLFRSIPSVPSVSSPERSVFLDTVQGVFVERLVIVGSTKQFSKAVVRSEGREWEVRAEWKEIGEERGTLVIHNLRARIGREFEVALMD